MNHYISNKFVVSSFAIALSATLISKPAHGAEELNKQDMNKNSIENSLQNGTKQINNISEEKTPSTTDDIPASELTEDQLSSNSNILSTTEQLDNTTNSDAPEEDNTSTDADNTDDNEEQTGDTSSTDQTTDQDPDNTTNSDAPEEDNTSTDADNTDDSEEQTGDTSSTDQTTDQDPDNTTNSDTPEEDNTSTDADNTDDSEEQTGDTSSTDQTTDQDLDNTTNSGTPEEDGEEDTTPPKNSNQPSDNAEDTEETPIPERPSDEDNISTPPKPNRPLEPNKPKPLQQQDNTNQRTNAIHSQTSGSQHQQTTVNSNSFDENQNSNDIADSNISGTTTYGDLATNESNQNTEQDDSRLVNRFHQMSTGSFKYNPFILNQVKQLNNNVENVSDKDISSIIRRQNFSDNAFLNELQKGTNYFKFQYFNPLKSRDYYKNLDKQVLALITGEIGSMPDLKKPESENSASGKYEYHSSSDEEMTHTKDKKGEDAIDIKFERTLFALIVTITMIFIGVVVGYFVRRRNNENN